MRGTEKPQNGSDGAVTCLNQMLRRKKCWKFQGN